MKYLYKILRLFFCPHKWALLKEDQYRVFDSNDKAVATAFIRIQYLRCGRCGKLINRRQEISS